MDYSAGESTARYSHRDSAGEQHAEPACYAAMRYIVLRWPPPLSTDFISCFPFHQRPFSSEIQELVGKGRLHATDDGIVLLVRQLPPPILAEPGWTRGLFNERRANSNLRSLLMPPWVIQTCHSTYSCHTTHTLCILERLFLADWYQHVHPVVAS